MLRVRINQIVALEHRSGRNNLYKRFRPCFDAILTQAATPSKAYVRNPRVENQLHAALGARVDSLLFFVGPTGIGKSTYIRHVFGTNQNPYLSDDSKDPDKNYVAIARGMSH